MKKVKFTILAAISLLLLTVGKVTAQTSRIQIIHNSPDYIIDSVDVWANNTRIANDLPFRKATQMIAIDSGDYVITVAKKFSTDTTAATSLLKVDMFRIDSGKTYLAFVSGVVDTTTYATNPAGLDRSLAWVSIDSHKSATTTNNIEFTFVNGVPDAPGFDLNRIGTGATKIGDDISYNMLSGSVIMPIVTGTTSNPLGNMLFNITSADSSMFQGAFKLGTASLGTKNAVVFTSGVYASTGNPTPAKSMKVFIAYGDGSVVEWVALTAQIQIVHNSADTVNRMVDVYINGVKTLAGLGFRTATAFTTLNALVPYSIAVAPNNSLNVGDAFYTMSSLALDSFTNYYAVACGVRTPNPTNFAINPNGIDIGFKIATYKGAKKTALFSKNVDLLYFHGVTDLQSTTIRGIGQIQFLSKNDSYQGFHGYGSHAAIDDVLFEVSDAAADTIMTTAFGDLMSYQGQAGLVFTSGFKQFTKFDTVPNPLVPKQQLDSAKLFIVWADGNVDTMSSKWSVGIAEQMINSNSLAVYPNPANSELHIRFESNKANDITIEIMDLTGKAIVTQNRNMHFGFNNLSIDVSSLNNGLYIMNMKSDQQVLSSKINVIK
ncbi:MAG: DUF4397 domain-containing protein [Bacteroidota bacterium]